LSALLKRVLRASDLAAARTVAWRSNEHRTRYAMRLNPRPLADADLKLILVWSPKSACSSALIWFYHLTGQHNAAQHYADNPHPYRADIFYNTERYRRALTAPLQDYRVIRIVRDPFDRAVSSFRHALRHGFADEAMSRRTGRAPIEGFSFAEFIGYLGEIDITRCNPHTRCQRHPVEDWLSPSTVINVSRQDLFSELNAVAAQAGLPKTDFSNLAWISEVEARRKAGAPAPVADADQLRLTRKEAAPGGAFPAKDALLSSQMRSKVRQIYKQDFDAYHFNA